jgi:cytidylate kinase
VPVVTISRQYGSLGDEIAKDLADRLGVRLVDKDIIDEIAQRLGVPVASVSERDEREGTLVADLVRSMRRLYPATLSPPAQGERPELDESTYLKVNQQVIQEIARSGQAVIVGRGSVFILGHQPDVVNVLIVGSFEERVDRVMATENLSRSSAAKRVREMDGSRARYARHFYRANWLDASYYDLILNTGHFAQNRAVSLICAAVSNSS